MLIIEIATQITASAESERFHSNGELSSVGYLPSTRDKQNVTFTGSTLNEYYRFFGFSAMTAANQTE
jgi:hypothetical protein